MYVSIPGKLSEIHLHAWLLSNVCGKVLNIVGISWSPDLIVQCIHLLIENSEISIQFKQHFLVGKKTLQVIGAKKCRKLRGKCKKYFNKKRMIIQPMIGASIKKMLIFCHKKVSFTILEQVFFANVDFCCLTVCIENTWDMFENI